MAITKVDGKDDISKSGIGLTRIEPVSATEVAIYRDAPSPEADLVHIYESSHSKVHSTSDSTRFNASRVCSASTSIASSSEDSNAGASQGCGGTS